MDHYADSSFLVSCYIADANSGQARTWLVQNGVRIPLTSLHRLEVGNALSLGVFRRLFTATAAWNNLEGDLRDERLTARKVNWPLALRLAGQLSREHSSVTGTRSLDVLHVAIAKLLRARKLVSFDSRQRVLAAAVGLTIAP